VALRHPTVEPLPLPSCIVPGDRVLDVHHFTVERNAKMYAITHDALGDFGSVLVADVVDFQEHVVAFELLAVVVKPARETETGLAVSLSDSSPNVRWVWLPRRLRPTLLLRPQNDDRRRFFMHKNWEQVRKMLIEFGLTPAARSRVEPNSRRFVQPLSVWESTNCSRSIHLCRCGNARFQRRSAPPGAVAPKQSWLEPRPPNGRAAPST
jgi:hypothetical protein